MAEDSTDEKIRQLVSSLSDLHILANAVIPRIAEVYGEGNQIASRAGDTEEQDFRYENGETSVLLSFFRQVRHDVVDALYENCTNLYAVSDVLNEIIADYRERDDFNADELKKLNDDLNAELDETERDNEQREKDNKLTPNAPPDTIHQPIKSEDEGKGDNDNPNHRKDI